MPGVSPTRVFIHGLESSSQGTKARFFRSRFPDMVVDDFHGDLDERMAKLETLLSGHRSAIIVGSSYGGLMAALFARRHPNRIRKLILLAPALSWHSFSAGGTPRLRLPVILYHGRHDDVVPLDGVRRTACELFANLAFHVLDDDHRLTRHFSTLDWPKLLETETRQP